VKSGVFLVAFCARLKTYGALFGDKNHKAFSRFCLCGHEKSGLDFYLHKTEFFHQIYTLMQIDQPASLMRVRPELADITSHRYHLL